MDHEFLAQDPWRVFRIMAEFVDGFEMMAQLQRPGEEYEVAFLGDRDG